LIFIEFYSTTGKDSILTGQKKFSLVNQISKTLLLSDKRKILQQGQISKAFLFSSFIYVEIAKTFVSM